VLFDAQVGAVGVAADDAKRQTGRRGLPGDQRTGAHGEKRTLGGPAVTFGQFPEARRPQPVGNGHADVER
jgi:hypothetical protein